MLSIVIPAYNEEKRLATTLASLSAYANSHTEVGEIIVINDGSTDATSQVFYNCVGQNPLFSLIKLPQNMGKGYAVREGLRQAKGDLVLFSDADLSTPINDLDLLVIQIPDADVVIGSRKLRTSTVAVRQPLKRRLVSGVGGTIRKMFFLSNIADTQCGFKLFSRKSLNRILPLAHINRYAFDIELLVIAQEQNLKVKEVAVTWRHDDAGTFHIWRASFEVLFNLFKIKKNQIFGFYTRRIQ